MKWGIGMWNRIFYILKCYNYQFAFWKEKWTMQIQWIDVIDRLCSIKLITINYLVLTNILN